MEDDTDEDEGHYVMTAIISSIMNGLVPGGSPLSIRSVFQLCLFLLEHRQSLLIPSFSSFPHRRSHVRRPPSSFGSLCPTLEDPSHSLTYRVLLLSHLPFSTLSGSASFLFSAIF